MDSIFNEYLTPSNLVVLTFTVIFLGTIIGMALAAFTYKVMSHHNRKLRNLNKNWVKRFNEYQNETSRLLDKIILKDEEEFKKLHEGVEAIGVKLTNNLMAIDSRFNKLEIPPQKKTTRKKKVAKKKVIKKTSKRRPGRPRKKA